MKKILKDTIYILLAMLLLNIVSSFVFFRWDFTANKRYSLSKASVSIIRNNQHPVVVDLYLTEDLPQEMTKLAKEFQSLLKEYKSLSTASFTVNVIYPNSNEKSYKATEAGIKPIFRESQEGNFEKIQKIFIGAVFKIGNTEAVLPFINYATPLEYEITRLLKQASNPIKPTIGFISGHDEASLSRMPQLAEELSHLSEVNVLNLNNNASLDKYNVLCIIGPSDSYSQEEIDYLEKYLSRGGRLFIALNHAVGQVGSTSNTGFINRTGLEDMLEKKGLKVKYDFVVDNTCGSLRYDQRYGLLSYTSSISFPYLPLITNFSNHIITLGLNSMLLPYTSSMEQVKTPSAYVYTPLARSSSISGVEAAPVSFNPDRQWERNDFRQPNSTVAALLTNADDHSAIVAISNARFLVNETIMTGHTDNINFAINSIEWLADNSGLIELRNKFTTFAMLEPMDEHSKEFLKYFNFLLPIIIIMVVAVVYYRKNQRKRIKRSRPGNLD